MATRIISAKITKKDTLKAIYKQQEVGKKGLDELFDTELSKKTTQQVHRDLKVALHDLTPHLMFRSELIDKSVAIPTSIKDEDWFMKGFWEDDVRFKDITVTGIKTFGKHSVEGVYLYGHKETEDGSIVELKSPLISIDNNPENAYPLHRIFSAQLETVITEIEEYLFNGKNVNTITNQLEMFK